MKAILCKAYEIGNVKQSIVKCDNIDCLSIYEKLNKITNNNWTYTIDNILNNENLYNVVITLFIKGRSMPGTSYGKTIKEATDKAIQDAYNIMFSNTITSNTTSEIKEDYKINDYVLLDNEIQNEYSTIEEIDQIEEETKIIHEDDDKCPIPGNNITNRQIRFINYFKDHNQIDTDEKFDYYIKTWATNQAVDNINTKKELIKAGYDMLESFISWIKIMQPILDNGIVSPLSI